MEEELLKSFKKYNPPTKQQKEQLEEFVKDILEDNTKE